jgi:prepilin-type N-terminal cleavage/methylation domain-containing protein
MRSEKRGFTLLEVLVVMFITGMILPLIGTAFYMLIDVPTRETGKLTTINDVQLAFNWIRDDAMRAQYYSGSPTMLEKVIAIDFDNCDRGSDCWAWESSGDISSEPGPGVGNPAVNPGDYNAIAQSDSSWWETDGTGNNDGWYNYHVYHLTIDPVEYPKTDINRLSVTWLGHGEAESGYYTTLKVWNHDTSSWRTMGSRDGLGGDGTLSGYLNPDTDVSDAGEVYLLAEAEHYYDAGGSSCPYLYAWNGTGYQFVDVTYPDAFLQRYEATSYQTTNTLEPKDGLYELVLHESLLETGFVNQVGLWAVDHPEGSGVLVEQPMVISAERSGTIHTVRDPQPVTAVDRAGNDVTDLLARADGEYWESDLEGKDFSNADNLFDWVTVTLPDKPEGGTAKLIIDARESMLGSFQMWYFSHFMLGSPNFDWLFHKLETDEDFYRYFDFTVWLSSAFTVQAWDGEGWVDCAEIPFVDHFFGRPKVVTVGLDGIEGNQLRIYTPIGLREIDYVAVDYTGDEEITVTRLEPAGATQYFADGSEADVLDAIAAADDSYAALEIWEHIECRFRELPPPAEGYQRTFVVPTRGYYYVRGPEVPQDKMGDWPLGQELTYVPYAFSKWTLPRYVNRSAYPCSRYCQTPTSALDIPVFPPNVTNSLHANFVRLTLVVPKEDDDAADDEEDLVYGSFSWVDRTGTESHSYTTQYYFSDNRLMRDEWVDNNLVSTAVVAHHIAFWEDVGFRFFPRGDLSQPPGKEGEAYLAVDIKANTSEGLRYSQWAESTETYTLRGVRGGGLSRGFAVLARGRSGNPVNIQGLGLSVQGNIYSYRGVYIGGGEHSITGMVEAAGDIDDAGSILVPEQLKRFSTRADASWSLGLDDFVHWPELKDREFIYSGVGDWDLASCATCYYNKSGPASRSIFNGTKMMTGVYYNPSGNINLTTTNATGMVTLIGERVIVTADYSQLSALSNGVVAYGTGTDDAAVLYNSDDPLELGTRWSGSLFAPSGGVRIGGKNFAVYGAVAAMRFFYNGHNALILY